MSKKPDLFHSKFCGNIYNSLHLIDILFVLITRILLAFIIYLFWFLKSQFCIEIMLSVLVSQSRFAIINAALSSIYVFRLLYYCRV